MLIDVRERGAAGDGHALDTTAIQLAIDEVAAVGGGTVLLPPGRYRSGTLRLKSRITLELRPGTVLLGSTDIANYPASGIASADKDRHQHHLLVIDDCEDVTICGGGTIHGSGPAFWEDDLGDRGWIRAKTPRVSPMVEIVDSARIRLLDITLEESPGWTLHLMRCDFVWLRGVRVVNHPFGPNNDGFDINGCRDVFVSDCHIDTCDDAIVLKTSRDARSCERVSVTNCVLRTNCAALKLGTESWHDFRHITFSNCVVHGSTRAFACYAFDGGAIEHVTVTGISCDTDCAFILNHPIHLDLRQRGDDSRRSRMRFISVSNFTAKTDGRILLTAADDCRMSHITLSDIQLHYPLFCDPSVVAEGATSAQCSRHNDEARGVRAAIVADGVDELQIRGLQIRWPEGTSYPDWGGGHDRIENGGDRRFGPADQGDDVTFAVVWGRGLIGGRIDIGGLKASDPALPAIDIADSAGTVLLMDEEGEA